MTRRVAETRLSRLSITALAERNIEGILDGRRDAADGSLS
jgi:hypothetical protein